MFYKERVILSRERQGITQKYLASRIGISNARYCFYENETEIIPIKHLNTVCNYFNVSLDYIFNFTDILNYENINKDIDSALSGKRLKEFRKENKLTQVKLAEILNTVHQGIANYENNKALIPTPFLYTICSKYKVSADYLLGKIDEPKYLKK